MGDFEVNVCTLRACDVIDGICQTCELGGLGNELSQYVELIGQFNGRVVALGAYACAAHIRHAINDLLCDAESNWRIYIEPAERVHSDIVHHTARDLATVAAKLRQKQIGTDHAADMVRRDAIRVHEAALFLKRYENMEGNNDE